MKWNDFIGQLVAWRAENTWAYERYGLYMTVSGFIMGILVMVLITLFMELSR